MAARLHPFVDGAFNGLFDGPTTTPPAGTWSCSALRDLPERAQARRHPAHLGRDLAARSPTPPLRRPRLVVVDEAWLLMRQPAGAAFLFRLAKAARKHWAGLTVATQDTADLLGSDLGRAVVANAATQILLRQAPQAIDEITTVFDLSAGERRFLLAADRGQGLLVAGRPTAWRSKPSPRRRSTTWSPADPAELATHAREPATARSCRHRRRRSRVRRRPPDGDARRTSAPSTTTSSADEGWVVDDPGWGVRGGSW